MMKYFVILLFLLSGCTRTVYLPEVHTEYRDRVRVDSIVERDSVVVLSAGDTVYVYRDRWRDRWHLRKDTVAVRDSIPYPVEVVREVRHVPRVYRWSLWIAIAALLSAAWKVARWIG
jgi:hypothetical protein